MRTSTRPRRRGVVHPGPIIATVGAGALALAILFGLWAAWSIRTTRRTLVTEAERDARALLESLVLASQYAIATSGLVDQLEHDAQATRARHLIGDLDPARLTDQRLADLARTNDLDGLTVWTGGGPRTWPLSLAAHVAGDALLSRYQWETDEPGAVSFVISDTASHTQWTGTGVSTPWGEIALWERATPEGLRPALGGIGELIQQIGQRSGIDYIMLQSPDGIVFASRPLKPVLKLAADSFLVNAIEDEISVTREIVFEGRPVLEAAAPFLSSDLPSGVFRVGVSLAGVEAAEDRLTVQLGVSTLLILLLSTATMAVVVTRRSLVDLGRSYRRVETLAGEVLDAIDQGVVAIDADRRITVFNPAAERLLGRPAHEVVGQPIDALAPVDFDLGSVGAGGDPVREREIHISAGDTSREVIYTTTPLGGEGGNEGAVSIIRDETAARALAEQMRRSERLSEMGHLAAAVAHDIRNPLNAIALAAQRLKSEVAEPEAAQLAATVWDESKRLNAIVEDFLSLARPSPHPRVPLDLGRVVNAVAGMAALQAEASGIALVADVTGTHTIHGAGDDLRKAIWNVLANALAATPSGGRVGVLLTEEGAWSSLRVDDSGPGIPGGDLGRVFQPWFTTKSGGTGLGLAITYRIVTEHGGTINIVSPPPEQETGTRVTIRLPRLADG